MARIIDVLRYVGFNFSHPVDQAFGIYFKIVNDITAPFGRSEYSESLEFVNFNRYLEMKRAAKDTKSCHGLD
jgi:hypothetical protein